MSKLKRDGGAAYPRTGTGGMVQEGMSLRAYLAAHSDIPWGAVLGTMAIAGNSEPTVGEVVEYRSNMRVIEAEALIKRLEEETA